MRQHLNRWVGPTLIAILLTGMLYQILVLTGQLSSANTWGGQIADESSRKVGIFISLTIQTIILMLLLMRLGHIKSSISHPALTRIMYGIAVLFFLNTLGNMMANNAIEQAIGTPLTGISAILFGYLAKNAGGGKS